MLSDSNLNIVVLGLGYIGLALLTFAFTVLLAFIVLLLLHGLTD
jgi:hypothetical protein